MSSDKSWQLTGGRLGEPLALYTIPAPLSVRLSVRFSVEILCPLDVSKVGQDKFI